MDSREQFEALMCLHHGYKDVASQRTGETYYAGYLKHAYMIWQASREALVVELPKKYVIGGVPVVTVAELKIRLDKAGIKWK